MPVFASAQSHNIQELSPSVIESAFVATSNGAAKKLVAESKSTIVEVVNKISCGVKEGQLLRYTAPDSHVRMYATPLVTMFKHDIKAKNGCLIPFRIHGWDARSAEELFFIVDYESLQTGDSARRSYRIVKQPDGAWLFKW